ncbi:hypothetical protein ALMP_55210 [Streptomyces sp. A012304]|nr:hypothetical protein ALMP_55210 [Streptomyces sp. A012304]
MRSILGSEGPETGKGPDVLGNRKDQERERMPASGKEHTLFRASPEGNPVGRGGPAAQAARRRT